MDVDRRVRVSELHDSGRRRRGPTELAGRIGGRLRHDCERRHSIGKARIAAWAMIVSGTCCAVAGFLFHAPAPILALFAVVWGVAVVADSAQLSALVAQYSPRDHVGTALTIQTCAGFLLTMISIRLLPVAAQAIGWQWVFICLVPGPFLGALALRGLTRNSE